MKKPSEAQLVAQVRAVLKKHKARRHDETTRKVLVGHEERYAVFVRGDGSWYVKACEHHDIDGIMNGYNFSALAVVRALVTAGVVTERAYHAFCRWFDKADAHYREAQELERLSRQAASAGYDLVKRKP